MIGFEPGAEGNVGERMNCPVCDGELKTAAIDSVDVKECDACHGFWFEAGQLRDAKDAADPDLRFVDFDLWRHEDLFHLSKKPVTCPRCELEMVAANYADTGVEVNCCTSCHAVWLDRGEFEKIITALEAELEEKDTAELVRESLAEARQLLAGEEGLLSDWRDLGSVLKMLEYRVLSEHPGIGKLLAAFQKSVPQ
jgi:Zn-finger nucleic acid-binding protein